VTENALSAIAKVLLAFGTQRIFDPVPHLVRVVVRALTLMARACVQIRWLQNLPVSADETEAITVHRNVRVLCVRAW
jgi:hypothetical protein